MNVTESDSFPATSQTLNKPRLSALTSLRFFAAAMVVLHHVAGDYGIPPLPTWALGVRGVSLFFVLSGFILAYNYPVLRIGDWRRFFVRRFARIWPAHAAATFIVLMWLPTPLDGKPLIAAAPVVAANFAMVHAWLPLAWANYAINGPSWSISTEFGFYLLFPLLILNFERTWWWKLALSLSLIAGLIVIANALQLTEPVTNSDGLNLLSLFYYNPFVRVIEFLAGMCTALLWRRFGQVRVPLIAATGLELLAIWLFFNDPIGKLLYQHIPLLQTPAGREWFFVGAGAMILPCALLIFTLASGYGLLGHVMTMPPLVFLGETSYSIYLLHVPVLQYLIMLQLEMTPNLRLLVFVSITLIASCLMLLLIERPIRNLLTGAYRPLLRAT